MAETPCPDPSSVASNASNAIFCMKSAVSYWLAALDVERDRLLAVEADKAWLVEECANRVERYEGRRDRYWVSGRQSILMLISAARAWRLPYGALASLVQALRVGYLRGSLPGLWGCGRTPYNEPPDFEPAIAEAKDVWFEAEVRGAGQSHHEPLPVDPAPAVDVPAPPVVEQPAPAKDVDKAAEPVTGEEARKIIETHCVPLQALPTLKSLQGEVQRKTGRPCSLHAVREAIKKSAKLRRLSNEKKENRGDDVAMTEAVMAATAQTVEPAPDDEAEIADLREKSEKINNEPMLRRLMADGTPEQRKTYLEDTPIDQLQRLAAEAYDDPDAHGLNQSPRVRGRARSR